MIIIDFFIPIIEQIKDFFSWQVIPIYAQMVRFFSDSLESVTLMMLGEIEESCDLVNKSWDPDFEGPIFIRREPIKKDKRDYRQICEGCGNISGKTDRRGNCVSCGLPLVWVCVDEIVKTISCYDYPELRKKNISDLPVISVNFDKLGYSMAEAAASMRYLSAVIRDNDFSVSISGPMDDLSIIFDERYEYDD